MEYKHQLTYLAKFALICLIVVSLLFIIFSSSEQNIVPSSSDPKVMEDQVTISETVFSASGKNPYKIVAKEVTHSNNGIYFLDTVSGTYNLDSKREVKIKAGLGNFNSILNFVELKSNVKISYLGYDLISEGIDLDLQHHSARSPNEVHMLGINGGIKAESFETTPEFNQITFHGNVKANFIINNSKH